MDRGRAERGEWDRCSSLPEQARRVREVEACFDHLDAPITRVTGRDVPIPYARNLEDAAIPDVECIIAAVRTVLYKE